MNFKEEETVIITIDDAFYLYIKTVIIGDYKLDMNDFISTLFSYMVKTLQTYTDIYDAIGEFTESIDTWLINEVYSGDMTKYHEVSDICDTLFFNKCYEIYYFLATLTRLPYDITSTGNLVIFKF